MIFRRKQNRVAKTISRKDHSLSRQAISENALKVLYRLHASGYQACLVGGGVRDLLLKRKPKDYDVATDAHPEQICEIFRNSRLIGRRFKLVHVFFQDEIIEVSTFRSNIEETYRESKNIEGSDELPIMVQSDNTFGTIEEDAWRRDFTINALYYNIEDFSIIDFTSGMRDLRKGIVRMIGDPLQRYHEDPVRLLRAIRMAAKLNFTIESATKAPLLKLHHLLKHVPKARLFDEVLKLFFEGYAVEVFKRLTALGYIKALFPHSAALYQEKKWSKLIDLALLATDTRFASGKSLNPGFLLSVFLWPLAQNLLKKTHNKSASFFHSLHQAMADTFELQSETIMITRRFVEIIRSIWLMQYHLERRRKKRITRILEQRYFRAGFDFLKLRADSGEPVRELADWWEKIQTVSASQQKRMIDELDSK